MGGTGPDRSGSLITGASQAFDGTGEWPIAPCLGPTSAQPFQLQSDPFSYGVEIGLPRYARAKLVLADWELWAAANMVLKQHGERAPVFVAERIGALALEGDMAGVETWKAIARRIVDLGAGARDRPH
jgi:hypothetical protein